MLKNPTMTFLIMKRINTKLFFDRTAAHFIEQNQIIVESWQLLIGRTSLVLYRYSSDVNAGPAFL